MQRGRKSFRISKTSLFTYRRTPESKQALQEHVQATKALFTDCKGKQIQNFSRYLDKHRPRIINHEYQQAEQICSIASGSIESAVKQVNRRKKISGAQWKQENVPQVLAHRCA